MLPTNFLIVSLLALSLTLPNGIRLIELPPAGESVEIVAGYETGPSAPSSPSETMRRLALNAYAAGGSVEELKESGRTGFRLRVPSWAMPAVTAGIADYFRQVPRPADPAARSGGDFRTRVEAEIRTALLGADADIPDFSTDRAFVVISGAAPMELTRELGSIPRREPLRPVGTSTRRLPAERTLRFNPDGPDGNTGSVIFASPVPGVYYREWYSVLLLDSLIQRVVPLKLDTSLPLFLEQFYYRIELPVPEGQLLKTAEESFLQEIERLQFQRAAAADLDDARADARAYLQSVGVRAWFDSHGIPERREEGLQWIESFSADDLRATARDLIVANRVLATWAPKIRQATVQVESLTGGAVQPEATASVLPGLQGTAPAVIETIQPQPFPPHTHAAYTWGPAERLASGVSMMPSNGFGVFVAGAGLTRFEAEPDLSTMKRFEIYRPGRVLVLVRPEALERARQAWSGFRGNIADTALIIPNVTVSSGDLPALLLLKGMLDRKLIEAGWWTDVSLRIDAGHGSTLQIIALPEKKSRVIEWMKQVGGENISDADFALVREVALHHFAEKQMDLQSLTWHQDPSGIVQDIETVSAAHVRDVARIYYPIL